MRKVTMRELRQHVEALAIMVIAMVIAVVVVGAFAWILVGDHPKIYTNSAATAIHGGGVFDKYEGPVMDEEYERWKESTYVHRR